MSQLGYESFLTLMPLLDPTNMSTPIPLPSAIERSFADALGFLDFPGIFVDHSHMSEARVRYAGLTKRCSEHTGNIGRNLNLLLKGGYCAVEGETVKLPEPVEKGSYRTEIVVDLKEVIFIPQSSFGNRDKFVAQCSQCRTFDLFSNAGYTG